MKIYLKQNVFEEALDRMRYLFDEFENVMVSISGGKDSTVTMQLALIVAEEKNRLPLDVMFLDQEAEWQCTVDHIRTVMDDPRVNPVWLQVPMRMGNASSLGKKYLDAWQGPHEEWMRQRETDSIHENIYGTDIFKHFFGHFLKVHFKGKKACFLVGVRTEESPGRLMGMYKATYKHITWGKRWSPAREQYNFYPVYDWSIEDVWKAIHDNDWPYCELYDHMYQHGIPLHQMRVSNLIHKTALRSMFTIQEIEPETWARLSLRVEGVNTTTAFTRDDFYCSKDLPFMFKSWIEYRDYLLDNLYDGQGEKQAVFQSLFDSLNKMFDRGILKKSQFGESVTMEQVCKVQINTLLCNDYDGTKIDNFKVRHAQRGKVKK